MVWIGYLGDVRLPDFGYLGDTAINCYYYSIILLLYYVLPWHPSLKKSLYPSDIYVHQGPLDPVLAPTTSTSPEMLSVLGL